MTTATLGDLMTGETGSDPDDLRARRRAFIRTNHPDVGGDPDTFARGLADFAAESGRMSPGSPASDNRMQVHRSRRPDRVVRGAVRDWRRRRNGIPPRRLK